MRNKLLASISFLILALAACSPSGKSDGATENNAAALSTKERQYFTEGQELYETYCASCHMEEGQGLGMLIPPLKNADYLLNDVSGAARIIKHGLKGPIVVNGKTYDQPMPGVKKLTPLEIAEILTFISNSWGNAHGGVTTESVQEALAQTDD